LPFADPLKGDPNLTGYRVFWNLWYRFHPRVEDGPSCTYVLDQYGNMTRTGDQDFAISQLSHVTDPGFPATDPNAGPYYYVATLEQLAPEIVKYLTSMNLLTEDPTKEPELYEFVPTLRRSLRLSQAARCAPIYGTDLTFDDNFEGPPGLPQLFDIKYLGERKILALTHGEYHQWDSCGSAANLDPKYYVLGSKGFVPFPTPAAGSFELRDVYVISMKRLPQYSGGYCYGNRVIYVDKENYYTDVTELYDPSQKLYKWLLEDFLPTPMPGGASGDMVIALNPNNTSYVVNFQDKHVTVAEGLHGCVDHQCDKGGYLDATRWALPEGLSKIMQ